MTAIQDFLFDHYQWLLVGHIVSMVAWMAGIFYLPRLFVYHAEQAGVGSETSELFKVMELKLFRLIMNPSMISTWVFGLLMIWANGLDWVLATPWLQLKLVMVSAMTWFHHWCGMRRKEFARDANTLSGRRYRLMNEVPTLMLVAIVVLAIVKPF